MKPSPRPSVFSLSFNLLQIGISSHSEPLQCLLGVGPAAIINEETETIVATGVILADVPCVDGINISKIKTGDRLVVDAEAGTVEKR